MQATKLELTINLKTAKALSLGVPLLGPADELIEKGAMSASGPKQTSLVAPTCPLLTQSGHCCSLSGRGFRTVVSIATAIFRLKASALAP